MYCTMLLSVSIILIGGSYSFSSTLLTQFRRTSSTIKLNSDEESWITSVPIIICPVGLILIGIMTDTYGRIVTLKIMYVPLILSWLILAFADSYIKIMIGRILLGIPFGICSNIFLYLSEMSSASSRSMYTSVILVAAGLGMMVECTLSMFFQWHATAGILATVGAVNFVTLFTLPESSVWLRSKGRADEADAVDEWFALKRADDGMTTAVESAVVGTVVVGPNGDTAATTSYWSLYTHRTVWKPALITVAFFACQQGTGVYALIFYTKDVIRECRTSIDGNTAAMCMAVARVVGPLCFTTMHALNRRTVVYISGSGMAVSLFAVVAYMKIFENVPDPPLPVLPAVALVVYMFLGLMGVIPLPWILCGEVFPMPVKGVMCGVVQSCGYILWFITCKIYPSSVLTFGVEIVWSIFVFFCVLSILFSIYIMPETRGKTLDEISSSMNKQENYKT